MSALPSGVEQLEAWIVSRVSRHTGLAPADIDPEGPLADLGLSSRDAVALAGDLQSLVDKELPATLLWEYPTVRALAGHLAGEPTGGEHGATAPPRTSSTTATREPIAVIGIGCRFPGADNPDEFWDLLVNQVDAVDTAAPTRNEVPAPAGPHGLLDQVGRFDAAFFGISGREAAAVDPQQRLTLEVVWEALEDAAIPPGSLAGSRTGVFVGISGSDYERLRIRAGGTHADLRSATGQATSIAANRLSYLLDLKGPSIAVDTACSSSLVAVHLACQSLRAGESTTAIVAGVNVLLIPDVTEIFAGAGLLAEDGRCKTFDARADGIARAEGCGALVLKPVSRAVADGDRILAVIAGSAINQDGRSNGMTAPNGRSQQQVVGAALADAGVEPAQVGYVEAHGTGTRLGDPIEVGALAAVLGTGRGTAGPCLLGSVKANIGHTEAAAGVAGLIKVVQMLRHGEIPPQANFVAPNPDLPLDGAVSIATRRTPWPAGDADRVAGVSSFGIGGTNAHVVVREAPRQPAELTEPDDRPVYPLSISARTPSALADLAAAYAGHIDRHPEVSVQDLGYTANTGRTTFAHRAVLLAGDVRELRSQADGLGRGLRPPGVHVGLAPTGDQGGLAFLFGGQGVQYGHMGRQLYMTSPTYRDELDRCDELLTGVLDRSLLSVIFPADGDEDLVNQTRYTQPALFATQYALAQLWASWGIAADFLLGQSIGELTAACVAGVLSLQDGLWLAAERGRLMQTTSEGATAVVFADEQTVRDAVAPYGDRFLVDISGVNSSSTVVISGEPAGVAAVHEDLAGRGIEVRPVGMAYAFHSRLMTSVQEEFGAAAAAIRYSPPRTPLVADLDGRLFTADRIPDANYWVRHLVESVRFADGVHTLKNMGCRFFLELGPRSLTTLCRADVPDGIWAASLRRSMADWSVITDSAARLHVNGKSVGWREFDRGYRRRKQSAPTYPFERKLYWFSSADVPETRSVNEGSTAMTQHAVAPSGDRVMSALTTMVSDLLGVDEPIDQDRPFLEMGADSLVLTQVRHKVRAKFDVEVAVGRLFSDVNTLRTLTAHVREHIAPARAAEFTDAEPPASEAVPAAATVPAVPVTAAASADAGQDAVVHLLNVHAQVMNQALDVLRGRNPEVVGTTTVEPRRVPSADSGPSAARVVPTPVSAPSTDGFDASRQAYVRDLVRRYCERTARSKEHATRERDVHSDSRHSPTLFPELRETRYPITVVRSWGARLRDLDGNEYVDLTMGFGVHLFGHDVPFVKDAIRDQLDRGMQLGPQSELAGEVAELLCEMTGTQRAVFCNTGSEAVAVAVRLARAVSGRDKIAMFTGSYHGSADLVLVRPKNGRTGGAQPAALGIPSAVGDDALVLRYGADESLETIRQHLGELAAVVVEPVQNRHPELQPGEFLRELRRMTEQAGVALVFDEVVTGFRVAPGGVQEVFGIRADLAVYGKVLGGGMPIGVVAGDAKYLDAVDGGAWRFDGTVYPTAVRTYYSGTFCKHPLAMAAAKAVLLELKRCGPELQRALNDRAEQLRDRLNESLRVADVPITVVNFGSILRFRFTGGAVPPVVDEVFFTALVAEGLHVWEGRNFGLSTAHTDEDLDRIVEVVVRVAHEMRAAGFFGAPAGSALVTSTRPTSMPLTDTQREIWFLHKLGHDSSLAFNENVVLDMVGTLDVPAVTEALQTIVRRHDSLRTTFLDDGSAQVVRPDLLLDVPLVDFVAAAPDDQDQQVSDWLAEYAATPFDLATGPLVRAAVLRLDERHHQLVLAFHHVVIDGWSFDVVLQELARLHNALVSGEPPRLPPAPQFSDHVAWHLEYQSSEARQQDGEYWFETFRTGIPSLSLATDHPRPAKVTYGGTQFTRPIDDSLAHAVRTRSRELGGTPFTVLFSAYAYLLHCLTGQNEIVVGVPVALRTREESDRVVGNCANVVPILSTIPASATVRDLVEQTQRTLAQAYQHAAYPLAELRHQLAGGVDTSRERLLATTFNVDQEPAPPRLHGLTLSIFQPRPRYTKSDLELDVRATATGYTTTFKYNTDLFTGATVQNFADVYELLLRQFVDVPDLRLDQLGLVPPGGLPRGDGVAAQTPRGVCLPDLVTAQAGASGDSAAVIDGERTLSYRELDARARGMAHTLARHGAAPEQVVAVAVPRSAELVVSLLAVLRAGAACLPVDLDDPAERIASVLADAKPAVLVVTPGTAGLFSSSAVPRVVMDAAEPLDEAEPLDVALLPGHPAQVSYPSGSVGRPKGVVVPHSAVVNQLWWMRQEYSLAVGDRVLQATSTSSGVSVWEFFWPLITGATLVLAKPGGERDPAYLAEEIQRTGVTTVHLEPSVLRTFLDEPGAAHCRTLRDVFCGGETLSTDLQRRFSDVFDASLHHVYGSAEAVATYFGRAPGSAGATTPTGRPVWNTSVRVLDKDLRQLPVGATGELYLSGVRLARGYLGRPGLTAERFVPDPFATPGSRMYRTGDLARWTADGQLEFLGRVDGRVTVRGLRVQLTEIEAVCRRFPGVRDVVIAAVGTDAGAEQLVGYVAGTVEAQELSAFVGTVLPASMVPSTFVITRMDATTEQRWRNRLHSAATTGELVPPEEQELLREWSAGQAAPPSRPVHQLVEAATRAWPDAVAVRCGAERLTFRELDERANRLANALRAKGVRVEDRVAVCLERTLDLPVALLGVLKAGAAYVPLDPGNPLDRLAFLVADADARQLVTSADLVGRVAVPRGQTVLVSELGAFGSAAPEVEVAPDNLAYVMHTSGSTGVPKGVAVTHGGLANYVQWARGAYELDRGAGSPLHSSFGFDLTVTSLFPALVAGRTVTLTGADAAALAEALGGQSLVKITPAHLELLGAAVRDVAGTTRRLVVGGEALSGQALRAWTEQAPDTLVVNEYGPTEAVVGCCAHEVAAGDVSPGAVPIGRPIDNTRLVVLNEALRPVPIGTAGELFIGGAGVARGYLGRPGLTAERFVPDPEIPGARLYRTGDLVRHRDDGVLEYLGRDDDQVKVRGYRIELGEIEMALARHQDLRSVAVVAREDVPGDRRLVAYVVPRRGPLPENLGEFLGRTLPSYMLPAQYVELAELPLTRNGKTDRAALPAPGHPGLEQDTAVEDGLAPASLPHADVPRPRHVFLTGATGYLGAFLLGELFRTGDVTVHCLASANDEREAWQRLGQCVRDYRIRDEAVTEPPTGRSGRGDRNPLPRPGSGTTRACGQPQDERERLLCAVFRDVLGVADVGVHDDFFSLGGSSLSVARLSNQVRSVFEVELPMSEVFDNPTVAGLVKRLTDQDRRTGLSRMPRPDRVPLSFAQQRLWFLNRLAGRSAANNMAWATRIRGDLDVGAVAAAFDDVIGRHESLRTLFPDVAGEPWQSLADDAPAGLAVVDVAAEGLDEAVTAAAGIGFDLRFDPPVRMWLFVAGPDEYVLLVVLHHIAGDWASIEPFRRDFSLAYTARSAGETPAWETLPVQYADYTLWQRELLGDADDPESLLSRQLMFWRDALAGMPAELDLPLDRPRPAVRSHRGGAVEFSLEGPLYEGLVDLARGSRATVFMVLRAVFTAQLSKLGAGDDIPMGVPVAGRLDKSLDDLVGFFVNTLVLRTGTAGDPAFVDLVDRVRETDLAAYAHQDVPFERLVEELNPERSSARNPLFQVMFDLTQASDEQFHLPGIDVRPYPLPVDAVVSDLGISCVERPGRIDGAVEYATDLFDRETAERLAAQFVHLVEQVVADPRRRIGTLELHTPAERSRLLAIARGAAMPGSGSTTVVDLFEAQARRVPDDVAVVYEHERITYRQLDDRANQLARLLRAAGAGPEVPVAIVMDKSVNLVVTVLAVWKAGAACAPVAPADPPARRTTILGNLGAPIVVTRDQSLADPAATPAKVILLDADEDTPPHRSTSAPPRTMVADNLCYVIHTSGSTGTPKGVLVSHRNLVGAYQAWARDYGLADHTAHLQTASVSVDVFMGDLVRALCSGAKLVLCPRTRVLDPAALTELIKQEAIDCAEFVPAVLRELAGHLRATGQRLAGMKSVIAGSDVIQAHELAELRPLFGEETSLVNSYGLTEATIDSTFLRHVPGVHADHRVLIGAALPAMEVYVLDEHLDPVAPNMPGSVYIGGSGVARGYLGRSGLTAERFVPHPWSEQPGARLYRTGDAARLRHIGGEFVIEFLGRGDRQVKVRGFRVEPREIEQVCSRFPGARDVAVTVVGGRLVAYVAGAAEGERLREFLADRLPEFMVPSAFVELDELPLGPSGELDRGALPEPASVAGRAPRDERERLLCGLVADVLGIAEVGVDDDFFGLGGHSLLVMRLVGRIRTVFGVELPIAAVFQHPTVAGLAEQLDRDGTRRPVARRMPRPASIPLSFGQQRLWILNRLDGRSPEYNMRAAVRISGELDVTALDAALNDLVGRHESLRTVFPEVLGAPAQTVLDAGIALSVVDTTGGGLADGVAGAASHGFDLRTELPVRATLFVAGPNDHVLLLVVHHIACDGWSIDPLLRDFAYAYAARRAGEVPEWRPLPLQYVDYSLWQRELLGDKDDPDSLLSRQLAFWRTELAGIPEQLELVTDRPRPAVASGRGDAVEFHVDAEAHRRLLEIARSCGATPFMVLHAVFALLLKRLGAGDDIPIGVPVAGRVDESFDELVGFFVNTVVLRADLSGDPTFTELVARIRAADLAGLAHQDLPFDRLVEDLNPARSTARGPLFQVMTDLQPEPDTDIQLAGVEVRPYPLPARSVGLDLSIAFEETAKDGVTGRLTYATDLFDRGTVQRMAGAFVGLVQALIAQPEAPITSISPPRDSTQRLVAVDVLPEFADPVAAALAAFTVVLARRGGSFQVAGHALSHESMTGWTTNEALTFARDLLGRAGADDGAVTVRYRTAEQDMPRQSLRITTNGRGVQALVESDPEPHPDAGVETMLDQWEELLAHLAEHGDRPIGTLPSLTPAVRERLLRDWARGEDLPPGTELLHAAFEACAATTPDAVAVHRGGTTLSYGEVNARANQLAHELKSMGVAAETFVGVCMEPGAELVVAVLGVLKAGGAYVPLDPEMPARRAEQILTDCAAKVLLTQHDLAAETPSPGLPVLFLDSGWDRIAGQPVSEVESVVGPDNPCYVIYTSGSTGRPKGVITRHRAASQRIRWQQSAYFEIRPGEAVVQTHPIGFDGSVWGIFAPLSYGGSTVWLRPGEHRDPARLIEAIVEWRCPVLKTVPSYLDVLVRHPDFVKCRGILRAAACGGEELPTQVYERFTQTLPDVPLVNSYGPTEATINATVWCGPIDGRTRTPIGRPVADTEVYLLDQFGEPVDVGVPGEIHIGGRTLARGYLGRPSLTAARFVPHPFAAQPGERLYRTGDIGRYLADGTIEFLHRNDHQVQVRGFRVELGEIEAALRRVPDIADARVLARREGDHTRLSAYLETSTPRRLTDIGERLRAELPAYMIPARFFALSELPRLPSGKVDYPALRALTEGEIGQGTQQADARTDLERRVAGIWAGVLDREQVSVHANFFALGGHSLMAIELMARISEALGVPASPRLVFESPTVAELAVALEKLFAAEPEPEFGPITPVARQRIRYSSVD